MQLSLGIRKPYSSPVRISAICVLLLYSVWLFVPTYTSAGIFHHHAKKLGVPLVKRGEQKEEIKDPHFARAARNCENWAWAAAVESILDAKNVRLPQEQWILRDYGGAVCVDSVKSYRDLAQSIKGEYMTGPGSKVALQAVYSAGTPDYPDPLIAAMRSQRPVMLVWKNHPYLVAGLNFDEYIAPNGQRIYELTALKLYDPLPKTKEQQFVFFVREKNDPGEIDGWMDITVTPMGIYELSK